VRGKEETQVTMLSLITADQLVPEDHPIREIKPIVDNALRELSPTSGCVKNLQQGLAGWLKVGSQAYLWGLTRFPFN